MSLLELIGLFLLLNVVYGAILFPYYKAAGKSVKDAFIPFYNIWIAHQLIGRPKYRVVLYFIPVINNIMFVVLWVELYRKFFPRNNKDEWILFLTLGLYFIPLARKGELKYEADRHQPKHKFDDWINAIVFAAVAATLVRTYTIEAYTIPTSSMEKTLMVGDYLFVSKWSYGFRTPETPLSLPFSHDKLIGTNMTAYTDLLSIPSTRLFSESPKANDIIVFNYPILPKGQSVPVDKKVHYVKRNVANPGDSLEIIEGKIYRNGKLSESQFGKRQKLYWLTTKRGLNQQRLIDDWDVTDEVRVAGKNSYLFNLQDTLATKFREQNYVESLTRFQRTPGVGGERVYPKEAQKNWSADYYGPLWIPAKGASIAMNDANYQLYKSVINTYDSDKELRKIQDKFLLGDKEIKTYTFNQSYYWAVGDNRDNSLDSRYWGFVPENHMVGRPVFIWMSIDSKKTGFLNKIRWERIFCYVTKDGELVSYKWVTSIILLLLYFGNKFYMKKRKKAKSETTENLV